LNVTLEQIAQLAPDEKSISSARQLLNLNYWSGLGLNTEAVWGNCQGSTRYAVRVDLANLGQSCNCPSRKRPCRHTLGLLMLLVAKPDALPLAETPPEVAEWLAKRKQRAAKQAENTESPKKPVDQVARQKRTERREGRVQEGVNQLQLWLCDLVRTGLGNLDVTRDDIWEEQARRLVDAQAPGLANRVRRLGDIPRCSPEWPQRIVFALGELQLLLQAYGRLSDLSPDLQSEIRQLVGWTVSADELEETGTKRSGYWIVAGQSEEEEDRFRIRRTWLQAVSNDKSSELVSQGSEGAGFRIQGSVTPQDSHNSLSTTHYPLSTNKSDFSLILQFAPGTQPFPQNWFTGTMFEATLLNYPGAGQHRAKVIEQSDAVTPFQGRLHGHDRIEDCLQSYAKQLAKAPWPSVAPAVLNSVTVVPFDGEWFVRDQQGSGLPIQCDEPWRLLAITGGKPIDLLGEWNGSYLVPLSMGIDGTLREVS